MSFLTKVGQLEFSKVADEQVLRFQVSVEDPPTVDVAKSSDQLKQEDLEEQQSEWMKFVPKQAVSVSYVKGRKQIQNKPGRCASAVRQDAGSYTGLGLFANAT